MRILKLLVLLLVPLALLAGQKCFSDLSIVIEKGEYSEPVLKQSSREGMDCSRFVLTKGQFKDFVNRAREIQKSDLRLFYSSRCELKSKIVFGQEVYRAVINAASTGYIENDGMLYYFSCVNHCRDIFDFGFNDPVEGEDDYLKDYW